MSISESLIIALRSLAANKLRAALTMLGIIIGTGAVIALISVGQGAQQAITEQIQSIGSNLIFVFPGQFGGGGPQSIRRSSPLTRQDARALIESPDSVHIAAVAPEVNRQVTVTYRGESVSVLITGATPEYQYVRNFRPEMGDFLTLADESSAARVAVLGAQTADDLFGAPEFALDETIRINQVPFRVIGVLERKGGQGAFGGGSRDSLIIIPLSTLQQRLFAIRYAGTQAQQVDLINVSATDETSIDQAVEEIKWILRQRRNIAFGEDDFTVASQEDILGVFNQITNYLTIFLGAIAGISLVVGGIGIMNIMLVSVTERTREIGIRKAVGAKRSHILWQFLIEAIVLSIIGGLIGIAFGWGVAALVNTLDAFTTFVSPQAVILAVSFSMAVGLFFGIYPASRAANLNPIDALRYE
ncbi:MAG: FtsX-like permease family protein [Chloroflexi bacterium]|nr:FtsX-like permease family protein [Chloroflexota bacterium]